MFHNKNKLLQYIHDFWHYRDLQKLLILKYIKLKYRRSFLGYVWSILNPLLIMIVMTVVFSKIFQGSIHNFPVYLFCGNQLFSFMSRSTSMAAISVSSNSALIKKTYVPKFVFPVTTVLSCAVELFFSLIALLVVMIVTNAPFTWNILLFPLVLIELCIFSIGLGLFLAQANVFFRDVEFIYSALLTAWMYLTPIFYPIESISEKLAFIIKYFNPMYSYITQFRALVYAGTLPAFQDILTGCLSALLMLCFGLFCFMKTDDEFIMYI